MNYNNHFCRQRLRALQGVNEIIKGVVTHLEVYEVLDNAFIFT